jgi:phage repressor protein C with HTH and peptisase S24 domain
MERIVNADINSRINLILTDLFKGNATNMARATFISRSTIYSIVGEKQVRPGYDILRRIVEMSAYTINIEWLLTGNGSMLESPGEAKKGKTRPRIPMSVAAGALNGFAEGVKTYDCEQVPMVTSFPDYDFSMIIKGDSMEPKYEGGDEIAIKKVTDVIEWGKVYVLDTRDGAVLKRLYNAGDNYRCVSYNKDYPDFEVPKNDVFGVYRVVGLLRI